MRLLLTIITLLSVSAHAGPPTIEVGKAFPQITMPALGGVGAMSIRDFRGQRVVLHVFASW